MQRALTRFLVRPLIRPVNTRLAQIGERLFQSGQLIDLAALATVTGGQVYDPITGGFRAVDECLTRLPCWGAPGGAVQAVAAFQEWDELVPPDPGDWSSNGGNAVITDEGGGVYRVQLPFMSGTYLRTGTTIGASGHTLSFEWRKTPGTSESGNVYFATIDAATQPANYYLTNTIPPEDWTQVESTISEDGSNIGLQVADGGGADFQIRHLSYRASDYALPFTGLSAGSTRAQSLGTVDLTGMGYDDDGCIIGIGIPYGWSMADRAVGDRPGIVGVPSGEDYLWIASHDGGTDQYDVARTYDATVEKLTYNSVLPTENRLDVVALNWNATGISMYVNGVLVDSKALSGGSYAALGEVNIGRRLPAGTDPAPMWNGVAGALLGPSLTATEHAALAACLGAGRYFPPQS